MESWKQLGWRQRREGLSSHDFWLVQGLSSIFLWSPSSVSLWPSALLFSLTNCINPGVCLWDRGGQEAGAKGGPWDRWQELTFLICQSSSLHIEWWYVSSHKKTKSYFKPIPSPNRWSGAHCPTSLGPPGCSGIVVTSTASSGLILGWRHRLPSFL